MGLRRRWRGRESFFEANEMTIYNQKIIMMSSTPRHTLSTPSFMSLEAEINWLNAVSPTKNDERWRVFRESSFSEVLPLTYPEISI